MPASNLLYVVTLTLNGLAHTKRLIQALAETPLGLRIIVIDQGSIDGTREWLRQIKGDGHLFVPMEGNAGVAVGWNLGLRIALANGAQAVLICGHDTVPIPGTLERLIAYLQAGVPFVTGTAVPYEETYPSTQPLALTDPLLAAPDFSFFVLPSRTIELLGRHEAQSGANISPWELGLFDSRFAPAYFEDNDYHVRLHRAGLFAARDPAALFRHDCSLTIRNNPDLAATNAETFQRNAGFFKEKWGGLPHELDVPPQARPLNVTDAQWQQMTGGRPVVELDRAEQIAQARHVYQSYGIAC